MAHLYPIHVRGEQESLACTDLLSVLENLLPVKFGFSGEREVGRAGEIIFEAGVEQPRADGKAVTSLLRVPRHEQPCPDDRLIEIAVRFADSLNVPFPFRGRSLRTKVVTQPKALALRGDDEPLAISEVGPIWSLCSNGGVTRFWSALDLPALPDRGSLQDVLNGDRFLEILPLLHFLRCVCADDLYESPPLRAQFMFDDPNLHWPSYGYVNYHEIATHAEKENYHVSFATIPLDTWITHERAAAIFRSNPGRLSLCVHGNNHIKRELARVCTKAGRASLLHQALRRMEALERETGVNVSRVMVPPHGACSHEMLEELPRCGFESACISHGSLRAQNRTRSWAKHLGYLPSEMIGGCPVLPRWGFANSNENTVFLAAYLRQPIILRGHHQDLKNGVELLDGFGRIVNSLGEVIWSDMANISRLNYSWRMEKSMLKVKPWARKLNIHAPEEAKTLLLERVKEQDWDTWQILDANGSAEEVRTGETIPLSIAGRQCITLEAAASHVAPHEGNRLSLPVAAIVRRLLTEGRDRLVGALSR